MSKIFRHFAERKIISWYCRSIDTKTAYKPPNDALERIRKIVETTADSSTLQPEWENTSLSNPKTKYTVKHLYVVLQFLFVPKCHYKVQNVTEISLYFSDQIYSEWCILHVNISNHF